MNLEESERFQKEYNYFLSKLDKIQNEKVKLEYKKLLDSLVFEVKEISKKHRDLLSKNALPDFVDDTRNKISSIRKKLDKIAKSV